MLEEPFNTKKFNYVPAQAVRIWIFIVAMVLFVLWLETANTEQNNYNLFLSGDSELTGAQVYIDGALAGNVADSNAPSLGGACYYGLIANGHHTIEVKKIGFKPFIKEIEMHGKDYINVELKP